MVENPTPRRAETLPVLNGSPLAIKTFEERLDEIESLLTEARLLLEELREANTIG